MSRRSAQAMERELARFPTQQGGGAEPTFSREINRVFDRAENEAKKLGDAYVSTEHSSRAGRGKGDHGREPV